MRVLVLLLALVASAVAQNVAVAKWGIPSFEDEACVLCQYAVQRVENALVQRLDQIDKAQGKGSVLPSTADPFATAAAGPAASAGPFGKSVAEVAGLGSAVAPSTPGAIDLSFDVSVAYKKELIRSLRTRWGGSSILRYIWEDFLTNFCAQDRLPGIYVPVCSMMYENARKMMKLIFYGFPNDQVCLMSKMCGKKSYFAAPTAVHDPVMSLFWNNKRGLDGFEGGVHGVTKADIEAKRLQKEAESKKAREERKKAANEAKLKLTAAERLAAMQASRALEDAKRALAQSELARREVERHKYEKQVEITRAEMEARKRAETEAREALAREANVRMMNLLPLSRLHAEIQGNTYTITDPSQSVTVAKQSQLETNQQTAAATTAGVPAAPVTSTTTELPAGTAPANTGANDADAGNYDAQDLPPGGAFF